MKEKRSISSSMVFNENNIIPTEVIANKIYLLWGNKVMLDKDLAFLYGVKPIRLREQVKRNILRFPRKFMFQLNSSEVEMMVSQNAIPSMSHLGGTFPFAFTEHGILMLANYFPLYRRTNRKKKEATEEDWL